MEHANDGTVSLPAQQLDHFEAQAAARGMSVSAWLTEAGQRQLRREWATATLAYCAQPEIAEQLVEVDGYFGH